MNHFKTDLWNPNRYVRFQIKMLQWRDTLCSLNLQNWSLATRFSLVSYSEYLIWFWEHPYSSAGDTIRVFWAQLTSWTFSLDLRSEKLCPIVCLEVNRIVSNWTYKIYSYWSYKYFLVDQFDKTGEQYKNEFEKKKKKKKKIKLDTRCFLKCTYVLLQFFFP